MIARVIVNHGTRALDKLYDYSVPSELENEISIGSRVKVPFGVGNREVEAYVFAFSERSRAKRLKQISKAYDKAFAESMCPLIEWLRDSTMCTYMDVIHVLVPRGSINKPLELIELAGAEDNGDIAEIIAKRGGICEYNELLSYFDRDISGEINLFVRNGVLKKVYRDSREVKPLTVRLAELAISDEEAEKAVSVLASRAPVQMRMLDLLRSAERISVADLVRFSDGSYAAVRALVKKGYVCYRDERIRRNPINASQADEKKRLTNEQVKALSEIEAGMENGFCEFLLHGVTGSGKTEVYLQAIEKCLDKGKKAMVLVPEISLTPQTVSRFSARFGERIAVLHSGLSLGERYDEWHRIQSGEADIVIGARSAVFAPMDNIGIIVIDEEHESSYKSDMRPRYYTADVARFRAKQYGGVLLLASATPRIETYYGAKKGERKLIEIKNRISKQGMPDVKIIDMKKELADGNRSVISKELRLEIEKNLQRGEQTILLLNRRGFSTFVSCRSCGYVAECPNCSISLTYHKFGDKLRCHYCGYTIDNYKLCPSCKSTYIRYFGGGTQKAEEELNKLFPSAKIMRMDNDTTSGKGGHEKVLKSFEESGADILIGTQMVAKGLDFPNVTLVGVISADTSLFADDFRAGERTFDLLEQVIGRAGRAEKKGRAIIQTYAPDNSAVKLAAEHDYKRFYDIEINSRKALNYPPFCDIYSIGFSGTNEQLVSECAKRFKRALADDDRLKNARVIGPIRASISKIQNRYRWQIIIKASKRGSLIPQLAQATEYCKKNRNFKEVTIITDKNPNMIF